MSTDYEPVKSEISFNKLKEKLKDKDAMVKYKIKYASTKGTDAHETHDAFCITDGTNFCWAYSASKTPKGKFMYFVRYGANDVETIIYSLEQLLKTEIKDEYTLQEEEEEKEQEKAKKIAEKLAKQQKDLKVKGIFTEYFKNKKVKV